ncbi:IucA/IucC family siderophore biosynthesis protein [Halobacillus salinarum]|uniref:IucA/IucC family siderophore biosynthesis protein n=1 Tax=Halobacillus salinarum TaxID=2932257 RepID=A0ABY4EPB4_9BACI|nr:IucA/IucC family protein [Halobacillus salinarum]UOQ43931.1 IucA/IucC family siderophore biosynthesis protein [Halobacillus salinarum]
MINAKELAEKATIQSFLNCYLRETGNYRELHEHENSIPVPASEEIAGIAASKLEHQKIELIIPIKYWSLTDRHLFHFPIYYRGEKEDNLIPVDYVTLISLIIKELQIENDGTLAEDELMLRAILSCQKIKTYVAERKEDSDKLCDEDFEYIEAEQSLIFGHLLHPTPKSRQGLTEREDEVYSPERKGEFQLDYFCVNKSLVVEDSSTDTTAHEIIFEELKMDASVNQKWLNQLYAGGEEVLIPVHPLQAKHLLQQSEVQEQIEAGMLTYLGPLGKIFTATSSFRTVYSQTSKYMYKFSVPIKITNSLRVNQPKELARGVEVSRLMNTRLGDELEENFPDFHIIKDPAYVYLTDGLAGFEVVIRENPFFEARRQSSLVAALCQDHAYGGGTRIASIINSIAVRENRQLEAVSLDWFEKYLDITLEPLLWLFHTYGIALEAHQQNSVIALEQGYPSKFYYRDNQGYYFKESTVDKLFDLLPNLNEQSDTICSDAVAEERLRYYFFFNHLFGLINGFGSNGLIAESKLLEALRSRLERHRELQKSPELLKSLLEMDKLPCKANLLTRFYDMDELVGPLESQSVYASVSNPLVKKVKVNHGL